MSTAPPAFAMKTLTVEEARAAVAEAMAVFNQEGNKKTMEDLVAAAAGDPAKLMSTVMPAAISMQAPTFAKYGFDPNPMGGMAFIAAIRMHAAADPALGATVTELQNKLMGR